MPTEELVEKVDGKCNEILNLLGDNFAPSNLPLSDETDEDGANRRKAFKEAREKYGVEDGFTGLVGEEDIKKQIDKMAKMVTEVKMGACGELAALAYNTFIKEKSTFGAVQLFEAPDTNMKDNFHAFVVLGLNLPPAGVVDITENDSVIIVDLWLPFFRNGWGDGAFSGENYKSAWGEKEDDSFNLTETKVVYPLAS